jgi:hypothetical protein
VTGLSLPDFGEGRVGFFLPSLGPHPTSLRSATLPEVGEGFAYSAATTRFPFAALRASTGARNAPV